MAMIKVALEATGHRADSHDRHDRHDIHDMRLHSSNLQDVSVPTSDLLIFLLMCIKTNITVAGHC